MKRFAARALDPMTQVFQAINVYFAFAAVVINAAFVVLILVRTSRTEVYMTFLFTCVASIVWNFGIYMTYFAGREFWFYFARIGSPMMPALLFHFINTLVNTASRNKWIMLAYTLSGLLSLSSFLAVYSPSIKLFVDSIYYNAYYLGALFPFVISGILLLVRAIRGTDSKEERDRYRYVLVATIIGTCTGLTDLIQIFHVPVPKLSHAGSVVYSSVMVVGIFKHRRTYDILAQMQLKLVLLGEMASGIAHEIRNPLSSIKGASKLLAAELNPKGAPSARAYLSIITEEIVRLDHILINFQHLTRPLNIQKEPVSVNEVIRKTVQLVEVGALPLKITADLSGDLPMVYADASSLKQVFLNLIKNASEACGENGELKIKTAYVPPWVKLTFLDNGNGIPSELLGRIFEPFFTTKMSGMGMGLSISRRIIQAHNGRIEARNAAPRGAEFSIFLPVSAA
jgi:signal transduction histidine kinase